MDLIETVLEEDNIQNAFRNTLKSHAKYKIQSIKFAQDEVVNLRNLCEELRNQTYRPSSHNRFYITDPKVRLIYSPAYRDKIVHHAINNILRDEIEPKFIHDSYSCIRGKGNQRALKRLLHFTRSANDRYSNPYVIKLDIKKFFYSIDHDVICEVIDMEVKCSWLRWILKLFVRNSPEEKGIPLGNLLSQLLINLMMNLFDQWVKRDLKVRYYMRYSDDMIVIVDGKRNARNMLSEMKTFINDVLRLECHPNKTLIHPLSQNIKAFGFYVNVRGIFITQETRKKVRKKLLTTQDPQVASSLVQWLQVSSSRRDIHRLVFGTRRWNIVYKGMKFYKCERSQYGSHRSLNLFQLLIEFLSAHTFLLLLFSFSFSLTLTNLLPLSLKSIRL